jgi:predicted enzyme related to lactoylglutathione lyase
MLSSQRSFIWYDLMTTDVDAALAFYGKVVGLTGRRADPPNSEYTVLSAGAAGMGGIMKLDAASLQGGARPGWLGYVAVADVDAMSGQIEAAGGRILHRPETIAGVGRFAVAADPHGAAFIVFHPTGDAMMSPPPPFTPGHVGWHELHAGEPHGDFAFYASLFGWSRGEAIDMGPMGTYQLFATGGPDAGGVVACSQSMPSPAWVYYINVDGVTAAKARVEAAGGQVVNGPLPVPGGGWILHGLDPQGAFFALTGPQ